MKNQRSDRLATQKKSLMQLSVLSSRKDKTDKEWN